MLRQVRSLHQSYWPAMAVRIKVMSGMNIAETRAPQDGRITLNMRGRQIDFRVSAQPTIHGENIVLRILDRQKGLVPLEGLGLTERQLDQLKLMIARPEGIILVTGPTGSGKTTTLYSILNHINSEGLNIMTLEDPVEYPMTLVRQTSVADSAKVKAGISDGSIEIVVGTHALLGKSIAFKDLGLLVVDEEQHFGVAHKERLKQLRAEVHVLTLTATPIPRTLQLAMTGVREMSIIATPPVDRLAVRTFIAPFDALMVREALLRERYRGGQAFYVCPRIEDLGEAKDFLDRTVPEVKVVVGHGQMAAKDLEKVMTTFYEGQADVLLSTTIVESGLDIPTANTLVVHRADMFGLAQLYQLRGRVGRAKARAYALFTTPTEKAITPQAERRLKVLQSLDTLGAGFQLASHDLDIRGAGNLLGEEQSGHIKEVGYELYQQMLEEAVEMMKAGITEPATDQWSPQITLGVPVTIPEDYVADIHVRLALYRRLADLDDETQIEGRWRPRWSTASARCRARSISCCRSSRSRRCAAAPMSKRSTPGRRAW